MLFASRVVCDVEDGDVLVPVTGINAASQRSQKQPRMPSSTSWTQARNLGARWKQRAAGGHYYDAHRPRAMHMGMAAAAVTAAAAAAPFYAVWSAFVLNEESWSPQKDTAEQQSITMKFSMAPPQYMHDAHNEVRKSKPCSECNHHTKDESGTRRNAFT